MAETAPAAEPLAASSTSSPSSSLPPLKVGSVKVPSSKTASTLPSPKSPKFVRTPVSPRSPKDMIGSHTELSTGIRYPYNMWGPMSKYGFLEDVPPSWTQKKHYGGKHDAVAKERLGKRKFGHIRHHHYKSMIEPVDTKSLAWLDPKRKEFWRTDVERVLHRDEDKRRAREKELLGIWTNEEAWRRHNATKMRDMKYQAYSDMSKNMRELTGCRNNKSGAPHINIITREPIGTAEAEKATYKQEISKYKVAARALFLQGKMSGTRLYNVINWTKAPPCRELPPWPEKPKTPPPPPPPDPRIPLNSSKGAISYGRVFGPFGTINDF